MADVKTDIEKWKINYPFLKELWTSYDKFDKTVQDDANQSKYETLCSMFLDRLNNNKVEHYNFCMKLLRNLRVFPEEISSLKFKPERCNNLNYWIYNSIKKHGIQDNLIMKCFEEYFELTSRATDMVGCNYHSYDKSYEDPMIAIMINIFNSHADDVIAALMNSDESTSRSGHQFVCECFKIYKDRNNTKCPNIYPNGIKKNTCDELGTFKNTYEGYLLLKDSLVHKIPSFNNIESEYKNKCQLYEQQYTVATRGAEDTVDTLSTSDTGETTRLGTQLTAGANDNADRNLLTPKGEETTGSPISSTISTAVGTMAGASSVLALLYKVNKNFI
ncbi:hypothetical protein PVNG_06265 [Plasmodium vivax North Korean]|uniref:Uncharacterized protein n=1 Tax=Plasmodium vivax North Korean TaxID=1035514 RepID=A0A0J9TMY9_PLAVI|nr:hypothetical protein PVNG_06265 [Plasmodium vivax North Korean]